MSPLVSSNPSDVLREAWCELAASRWATARNLAVSAMSEGRRLGQALHIQALAAWGEGDRVTALELITKSASHGEPGAMLLGDLGMLRFLARDWDGALDAFNACLRLEPEDRTALQGRIESCLRLGQYNEAEIASRQLIGLDPDNACGYRLFAASLTFAGREDEAMTAAAHSLDLDPNCERTLLLVAAIYQKKRLYEACLQYCQTTVRLHPDSAVARARLAIAFWDAGDLESATLERVRATELGLLGSNEAPNLDWLALHDPRQTASSLLELHRESVAIKCGTTPAKPPGNTRDPERRLRVGYLSGEFVWSPAYCFLVPWLQHHDGAQVETFYYMSSPSADERTDHYRQFAVHWRDVWKLSDEELVEQIRVDGVDILVDLSGHFEHNRLTVFARRPAPVQVTFPNYPGTTGLAGVDYILTDEWTTPHGCEPEYAEQPFRLPSGCLVFQAPSDAPPVSALPAISNGYITFGLFQRPGKLHAAVWDAIAGILAGTPNSRLLVHFALAELDEEGTSQRARLSGHLESRGISPARLKCRGARRAADHLAVVAEADIALDTFPYNGQTTTCDCLWMGVPVVSLRGKSHVARVTPALLDRMRLGNLAAPTVEDYVKTAIGLADNLETLDSLRRGLRESMHIHSLTDGARLAREIECAYRVMWRNWCQNGSSRLSASGCSA